MAYCPTKYSIIIPVFNRPDEIDELLGSLERQTLKEFEVIVVEDGSSVPCKDICCCHQDNLDLKYFFKENSGPGQSRNFGVDKACGEWMIILDSDVILPKDYLLEIDRSLAREDADAFGGPDAAADDFTPIQKAISYGMTSFFTTGGIRGGKRKLDKFYPRSFNMGVRRSVYLNLGGFSKMRFGEDIDFSIRIFKGGWRCRLIPQAWVYHRRRTDFRKFFRQVYNSGIARINLYKKYPESLKAVHLLPAAFTLGVSLLAILGCIGIMLGAAGLGSWMHAGGISLGIILAYMLLILVDSTISSRSLKVGFLSIAAAFVQLYGYGLGFLNAWWRRCIMGRDEFNAFEKTFYK